MFQINSQGNPVLKYFKFWKATELKEFYCIMDRKLARSPYLPLQQLSKRIIIRKMNDNENLKIKSSKITDYINLGSDFNSCFFTDEMNKS
ncbi:hypothetical protein J437_LFUL011034 [Ladona fulva]|uniref:Uncharacterized protein n=1 Tax=Ladona fulva TaxID=123851 RepID=A0A8K0P223_LADFU|nr:hypothetical protein J437_LFUL011034 [Ladona fulva]